MLYIMVDILYLYTFFSMLFIKFENLFELTSVQFINCVMEFLRNCTCATIAKPAEDGCEGDEILAWKSLCVRI
jgi:hypothetical protein